MTTKPLPKTLWVNERDAYKQMAVTIHVKRDARVSVGMLLVRLGLILCGCHVDVQHDGAID